MLQPLRNLVLVQRHGQPTQSSGGLFLPQDSIEQSLKVTVLAVGPGELLPNGERKKMNAKVGMVMLCRQWSGLRLEEHKGFLSPCLIPDESLEAIYE